MLPSLNYDPNDPKFILLSKIFKIIGAKKVLNIYSRNGITNRKNDGFIHQSNFYKHVF